MDTNSPLEPVSEDELHAYVDGLLGAERRAQVRQWLLDHPEHAARVDAFRRQNDQLRALFKAVLDEPVPARLLRAAAPRFGAAWQRLAAGVLVALLGGVAGWQLRAQAPVTMAQAPAADAGGRETSAAFARRAAVAHAVYAADQRRPVEIDAGHEDQLVAWVSKRMGDPIRPPHLQALGYTLDGGRLLPGASGPVAQFMYTNGEGRRLTLYVANDLRAVVAKAGETDAAQGTAETAFRYAQEGSVNVFYWVDGRLGYAIAADESREVLGRVSGAVYRALEGRP